MLARIRGFLAPPIFEDENKTRVASLLNAILLLFIATSLLVTPLLYLISFTRAGDVYVFDASTLVITSISAAVNSILLLVMRRGRVRSASIFLSATLFLLVTISIITISGLRGPSTAAFAMVIALAGLLLGGRAAMVVTVLSLFVTSGVFYAESNGILVIPPPPAVTIRTWLMYAVTFGLVGLLLRFATNSLNEALANLHRSNRALEKLSASLEERVASRTRALETSTEVSRSLSTILDQEQLVAEVVEQVQRAFNYYHAHIYVFDEAGENLVMAGGTGDAGRAMLAGGHKLPRGKGLVGRAAETNSVVLVPDVSQEEGWLPNPLLPDTKAEIAVPIAVGDRASGVLDVQHDVAGGLTGEDANLLQSVANQVAIALRNARLYKQAQQQAEREAIINVISQKIQMATDVESVLQIAAEELGQALGAQSTNIQLSNRQTANGRKPAS